MTCICIISSTFTLLCKDNSSHQDESSKPSLQLVCAGKRCLVVIMTCSVSDAVVPWLSGISIVQTSLQQVRALVYATSNDMHTYSLMVSGHSHVPYATWDWHRTIAPFTVFWLSVCTTQKSCLWQFLLWLVVSWFSTQFWLSRHLVVDLCQRVFW